MTACQIDHLTITAPNLEAGAAFVHQILGVMPQTGGAHPRMGTHNLLLRLGDALFLEVIAVDPRGVRPDRARWFDLDSLAADAPPRLATWVAHTADIDTSVASASEVLGMIEPMSRGALNWRITIPTDGRLPLGGAAPALIQWQALPHPAAGLKDLGVSLVRLELHHPEPERVSALLKSIGCNGPVVVWARPAQSPPCLVAHIDTPAGRRTLSTADGTI